MPSERVVVAGNVDDGRSLSRLAQDLLHDVVVRLRPEPAPTQLPAVDNVADEVQVLRFGVTQEIEKEERLTGGAPEMQIGDPDGAEAEFAGVIVVHGDRLRRPPYRLCRYRPGAMGAGLVSRASDRLHARQPSTFRLRAGDSGVTNT